MAITYRDYTIERTSPVPPIPQWRDYQWTYTHKDYGGPGDRRNGMAPSVEECMRQIDELIEDESECVITGV